MTAEIVSVGTELLLGQIADTDAQHLGQRLAELGIAHTHRQTVGDNLERLADALRLALSRADIVFTVGGLGPTEDDLTREAIAKALDEPLKEDEAVVRNLREWFAKRGLQWIESQRRQAMKPDCAKTINNPNGTAPGLLCEKSGKIVIALPGPPGEFLPLVDGRVGDYLRRFGSGEVIHSRIIRICGLGESVVEDRVRPLLSSANPTVAPYAHPGEVHLRLTAKAPTVGQAEALIRPVEARIKELLGDAVFGTDDTTLEQAVVELLVRRRKTVAVAESMTGGGLGERLTNVAGSGEAFVGGIIAYDTVLKTALLGIDPHLLNDERRGPVSEECARQMAIAMQRMARTTFALSITGNAGPTSDRGAKPVGTVFIGLAGPAGCAVKEHLFHGERGFIRRRSQQAALDTLRQSILKAG